MNDFKQIVLIIAVGASLAWLSIFVMIVVDRVRRASEFDSRDRNIRKFSIGKTILSFHEQLLRIPAYLMLIPIMLCAYVVIGLPVLIARCAGK